MAFGEAWEVTARKQGELTERITFHSEIARDNYMKYKRRRGYKADFRAVKIIIKRDEK